MGGGSGEEMLCAIHTSTVHGWILCTSSIIIVHTKLMIKCEVWDSLSHNRFIFKSSASVSLIINGNELEILNLLGGAGKTLNVKRCVWKRVYHPIVIIPGRVGESAGGGGSSSVLFIAAGRFCWKHTLINISISISVTIKQKGETKMQIN